MQWLRGAPDGRTCAEGGPRAAAGCAGCRLGLLPRAAPPPSRAPGPAPIWGGPTACGGPGSVGGKAELAVGAEHPPSASAAAVSRVPRPTSLILPPLAGLGGLCEALNDLCESNPSGELGRNAEAAFSPSSFERVF